MGAAVVAHGDAAPVLEFSEHVLDFVALAVERGVVAGLDFAITARRDAGDHAFMTKRGA